MRKAILTFLLAVLCVAGIHAQQKVVIYLNNGQTQSHYVWDVSKIVFEDVDVNVPAIPLAPVDMGLDVQWAPYNFGASLPKERGFLLGWGAKSDSITTRNLAYYPQTTPTGNIINTDDDLVKAKWGDKWRVPSAKEIRQLVDSCDWTWVNDAANDSVGFVLVNKKDNTKSMFLPVTGYREETDTTKTGLHYWTGTLSEANDKALSLSADTISLTLLADADTVRAYRYLAMAIRPVYGDYKTGVQVVANAAVNIDLTTASVPIELSGDLEDVTEFGLRYGKSESDLAKEVKVSGQEAPETYTFKLTGLEQNTLYYYKAYAKIGNDEMLSETGSFKTKTEFPVAEAVDMGLSVKWASWNMGATAATEMGGYYHWSETDGKGNYNADSAPSNLAGTSYDMATKQWGEGWQLPTVAQMQELLDNCTWESVSTYNGVSISGYKVTSSKNGAVIFIPSGGYYEQSISGSPKYSYYPFYWSSEKNAYFQWNGINSSQRVASASLMMHFRPVYVGAGGNTGGNDDPQSNVPGKQTAGTAKDLGLSVYWADTNIGASYEYAAGEYYAWGDTIARSPYSKTNYVHYNAGTQGINRVGSDISGNEEYDAARYQWGGKWRMPTQAEFSELVNDCDWEWTTVNNVEGFRIYHKQHHDLEHSIFLPISGYMSEKSLSVSTSGFYWFSCESSSTQNQETHALMMSISSNPSKAIKGEINSYDLYKWKGCPIRPVRNK